jgi:hypothetical protein
MSLMAQNERKTDTIAVRVHLVLYHTVTERKHVKINEKEWVNTSTEHTTVTDEKWVVIEMPADNHLRTVEANAATLALLAERERHQRHYTPTEGAYECWYYRTATRLDPTAPPPCAP